MRRSLAVGSCVIVVVAAAVIAGAQAPASGQQPPAGQAATWAPPNEAGEGQTPIMPVQQEPHHRQLFQYGTTRIIDLQIPPGDTSWFHTHEWPVFYLTVADSQTRTQVLGEEWGAGRRGGGPGRAGAPGAPTTPPATPPAAAAAPRAGGPARFRPRLMSDTSYAQRAVTHRIGNTGTGLYRAIGVINETQGGDESVTEEAAGFTTKAESSNRWFRVYRIGLGPGEKTPPHQHKAPVVILEDTTGKGIASGAMKFEINEPGQWAFFDANDRHEIANTSDGRLDVIEVEVRRK